MAKFLKFKEEKREYSQLANPLDQAALDGLNDQEIYQRYRFTKEVICFSPIRRVAILVVLKNAP